MNDRPLVVVTESLAEEASAWLAARCEVVHARPCEPGFSECAHRADALIVRTYTLVNDSLLALLPRLRVVGRAGVGLDNIDAAACARRGVRVVHTPDANTQAVVEYVVCLLCDALRPRVMLDGPISKEEWHEVREEVVGLWQMDELVLGILGLGRIGRRVAQVARAIGFAVLYNDLLEIPPEHRHGAEPVELDRLLRESDVLTVHIDGRPSNRGFLGEAAFALCKPDATILNTSRGFVIDTNALAAWLRRNTCAKALLDVHDPEPIEASNPLFGLDNAYLFPHLASRTLTAMSNMSWVVREVVRALEEPSLSGAACRHPHGERAET